MDKKIKQNIFIFVMSVFAVSLFFITIYSDYKSLVWSDILFWCVLAIIAETFLIISPSGVSTSVAPAIYICIAIVTSPSAAMIIILVGGLLKFPEIEGEKKHIFNTRKSTTLFNIFNGLLSLGTSAWVLSSANIEILNITIMVLVIVAVLVAIMINFVLVAILLKITQNISPLLIFKSMIKTSPSTIGIGMLGLFLAYCDNEFGPGLVLIFFVPLLLARYSFKLYFESQRMALDTIHALNEALHAKDAYTGGHTGRVEQYAVDLAAAYGLPTADCELIRTAALLHDIGKIGIPDEILNKPGRLTRDEFALIQEHSSIGAKILGNVNSLKRVSQIIVQHHERYDGSGYPNKLKGDEIAIEAAILMISDSYDAMTTDRPYRKALTNDQAISELLKYSGTQFHPMLTKCFVEGVLRHIEQDKHVEDITAGKELLAKTKDLIEAGIDFPKDIMESEINQEDKKSKQNSTKMKKVHPMRLAKENH